MNLWSSIAVLAFALSWHVPALAGAPAPAPAAMDPRLVCCGVDPDATKVIDREIAGFLAGLR